MYRPDEYPSDEQQELIVEAELENEQKTKSAREEPIQKAPLHEHKQHHETNHKHVVVKGTHIAHAESTNSSTISSNPLAKLQQKIWENRTTIVIVLIIALFGLAIRANLVQYEGNYLFEPDASYHARMILNYVRDGQIYPFDILNYYQVPGGVYNPGISVYWFLSAVVYWIVGFGQPFNKELLIFTVQFMPCIFGALAAIAMYFLGKEVFNDKKIGYIAAFMTAVTPAFVYRTMAGAQGDNSLGFLWMIIGFYFLVKAIKTKSLNKHDLINSVLAGIFFGIMAMTWDAFLLIPMVAIPSFIGGIVLVASKSQSSDFKTSETIHYAAKYLLTLIIFSLFFFLPTNIAIRSSNFWLVTVANAIANAIHIDSALILGIIIIGTLFGIGVSYFVSKTENETKKAIETLSIVILILGVIVLFGMFFTVKDFFYGEAGRTSISSLVGEESVGNQFFGTKYNSLIIFPFAAIILLPIGLYFFRKDDSHTQLIFFFWTIVTLFMAWYKLKFTFFFGLGVVTGAAITCYLIFEALKKLELEKGLEAKATIVVMGFLILLGVGASAIFVPDYVPFPNQTPEHIELIKWINENTVQDSKFFIFWNDGHVLTLHTERRFSSDNRNESPLANKVYAQFVIDTNAQHAYELETKEIGADYVILESSMINSLGSFEYYANDTVDNRLAQKYYVTNFFSTQCSDLNSIMLCGGNEISKDQWEKIATTWKSNPDAFPDGKNPVFYYRLENELFVVNQPINNTNLMKILMSSVDTNDKYTLVFNVGDSKVYKINN